MAAVGGMATIVALRFWALGAWPVLPFSILEVGGVLLMLRLSARQARATELILLTEDYVRIIRTSAQGQRQETALPAGWLTVALEERPGRVPALLLRLHGRTEEVARALGEAPKRDLAESLARVLHRMRNPVFDNPQTRDSQTRDPQTRDHASGASSE